MSRHKYNKGNVMSEVERLGHINSGRLVWDPKKKEMVWNMASKKKKKKSTGTKKKSVKRSSSKSPKSSKGNGGMAAVLKKLTKTNLRKVPTKTLESAGKKFAEAAVNADIILDERGYSTK
jgi:hypothetical protein